MTNLTGDYWGVEVPRTAYGFRVLDHHCALWYMMPPLRGYSTVDLPIGQWEIVGKDITEEQAKGIVGKEFFEDDDEYYYIYEADGKVRENLFYDTALESFHSLLKSKNLNPSQTLILKRISNG